MLLKLAIPEDGGWTPITPNHNSIRPKDGVEKMIGVGDRAHSRVAGPDSDEAHLHVKQKLAFCGVVCLEDDLL